MSKCLPTGEHEKDKVRVLVHGDNKQEDILGETNGQSIYLLACIAAVKGY